MRLNKEILYLAIPNIISNISVPLMSSVDTGLMGRMSTSHVAAIGISSMLFNLLYWNFGFLRMGTTGMVAQAFGKKSNEEVQGVISKSILLALIIALFILVTQQLYFGLGAAFLKVNDQHMDIVTRYFNIRIWDAPATLLLYCLMGIFFGLQNAVIPLVITILINVVNIGVSYYLVAYADMNVEGVAWGTVIAQYLGCLISFIMLKFYFKYSNQILALIKNFDWRAYGDFLKINGNIFVRTVSMTIVFALLYRFCSERDEMILASSVIVLQLVNWMSYGVDGFAFAAESLVGKYKGAGNIEYLKKVILKTMQWGFFVALLFSIVYWIWGAEIIALFTTEKALIAYTWKLKWILVLIPIFGFGAYILDGIFVGLVASRGMRDSMVVSLIAFLIIYFVIPEYPYARDVWYAMIGFLLTRSLVLAWIYNKMQKKNQL